MEIISSISRTVNYESRGKQDIFMCLAALLSQYFCRFANGGAKISTHNVVLEKFSFDLKFENNWTRR